MGKFIISYRFRGSGSETITADSLVAAQAIADKNVADEDFEPPADNFDDIDASVREMHPVTRGGREIWATYILPTDTRGHASALKETPLFSVAT